VLVAAVSWPGLSVLASSVSSVDGGHHQHGEQPPDPGQPDRGPRPTEPTEPSEPTEPKAGDALARALAAAWARNMSDADTLADSPYLKELLSTVNAAIDEVAGVRWAAVGPLQVAAMLRQLHSARSRLDAAILRGVKAVDDRDDVITSAGTRTAAATFLHRGVGLDRPQAGLDADAARLLDEDTGDLARVGAAYAAGDITRGHVDICVRVHRRLTASVRDALIPVVDADTGQESARRCIEVVDATLARQARAFSVSEFRRITDRLLEHLDPPSPAGAHERRYLHLSRLPDGSLRGRFACGPAQALTLTAVIAAGAAPQPGLGVDEHGVAHQIPDERDRGQRQMDALVDALNAGTTTGGTATNTGTAAETATTGDPTSEPDDPDELDEPDEPDEPEPPAPTAPDEQPGRTEQDEQDEPVPAAEQPGRSEPPGESAEAAEPEPGESGESIEPRPEGEYELRRPPGVRTGPYPTVEILVTATVDQLAAARALARPARTGTEHDRPPWPDTAAPDAPPVGGGPGQRGLEQVEGFARAQHGGPVHPATLALLACTGRLRRVLLDPHGAVLHLGRSARLASPAQRRALLARDGGCVVPGCLVPGEHCDVHHPLCWVDGGGTDITNLALLCPRHHTEVHDGGSWQIEMIRGVPWVRPPAWAHPTRPLLRNTAHGAHGTA
jgi:Domain of unknown function (DUF222)